MDVFSLTETEFFRKLTYGENDNLHIAHKDFVLQVSELCNKSHTKAALIKHLQDKSKYYCKGKVSTTAKAK